jgi:CTP synthase (UTP-ammonia lyase)
MIRIALVGDRAPYVRAHSRIPLLLAAIADSDDLLLDIYWVPTCDVDERTLKAFDAIWLVPGSPYRDENGAVEAVRIARVHGIPFLGTCGGFQHALLEFARNECGFPDIGHAENAPGAKEHLIIPLACPLVAWNGDVRVQSGSLAKRVLGTDLIMGRYHCAYGLSSTYRDVLQQHGMRLSGVDEDGEVCIAELPDHPFFLATLFQPELSDDDESAQALTVALTRAAVAHKEGRLTSVGPSV